MKNILEKICETQGYKPRDVQYKAIEYLEDKWDSKNKCKVLSMPTGSGKSVISMVIGEYCKQNSKICSIITPQNLLIDQYCSEFKEINYLKGKKHYPCNLTETNCEEGEELQKIQKKNCIDCPYKAAKDRAYSDHITIFNPMSYYSLGKVQDCLEGQEISYYVDTIIVDEFQSLPAILRELSTIKLWENDIRWESGVSSSIPNVIQLLQNYSCSLSPYIMNRSFSLKERLNYTKLQRKIDFIVLQLRHHSDFFICEESQEKLRGVPTDSLTIRPKYVPLNINNGFFKIAKRIILMSGTAFPNIWEELGFKEVDYIDLPSPIPKERRQIFATNSININSKLTKEMRWATIQELSIQIKYITQILHEKENGVILLPYNLANELKCLLHESYFIHMDKSTKKETINKFKEGKIYGIGVFSGSYEGLSLNGDISRFTIIPKVPYPNLMDRVVKVRMKENPLDYSMETITTIIQASGRSTRSEKDYSYTYILDSNFASLYPRVSKYIPQYFKESLNFSLPTIKQMEQLTQFRGKL